MSSTDPAMTLPAERRVQSLWVYLAALFAYGALFWLGYWTSLLAGGIAPFWLSTGFGIWLVMRFGARMIFVIFLGAFPSYHTMASFPVTELRGLELVALTGVSRALAALVGAWVWRWGQQRWPRVAGRFGEPVNCVLVAFAAALVAATLGSGAVILLGYRTFARIGDLWAHWVAGDVIGIIFSLPIFLSAPVIARRLRLASGRDWIRGAVAVAAAVGVSALVFEWSGGIDYLYALFPVLLLATGWFGALGARLAAFLFAGTITLAAIQGHGPFVAGSFWQNDLTLQLLLLVVGLVALLLPAVHVRRSLFNRTPLALLLVGWGVGGAMFALVQHQQERTNAANFARLADNARNAIEQRLATYVEALRIGESFVAATPNLGRDAWATFADTLRLPERYPGIQGIGVIYPVARKDTTAFLQRMRADGFPNLKIRALAGAPDGEGGPEHFVVTFLAPLAGNESALGLDLATETNRRVAAEAARDTGLPQITAPFALSQDAQQRPWFMIFIPVYQSGAPVTTVAERRAACRAWVDAPFVIEDFMRDALGSRARQLQLSLFNQGRLDAAHLVFSTDAAGSGRLEFRWVNAIKIGGLEFKLGWNAGPGFVPFRQSPLLWLALSLGVLTVLLTEIVLSLQAYREQAEELSRHRLAAQQQSEARFQAIFEQAAMGVTLVDLATGRYLRANQRFCRIVGYAPDEIIGRDFRVFTHPDDVQETADFLQRLILREVAEYSIEKRYRHKDGHIVWARVTVSAMAADGPTAIFGIGTLEDITARKRAEADRQALEQQLRQSQKLEAIGTMAGGIAHDFNNILSGIYGFTALAQEAAGDHTELRDYLSEINRASRRAAELVQQILAFSRTRGGDETRGPVQLDRIVTEAVKLLRAMSPSTIEIVTELAPDLPTVEGNASQLHQVVMNLGTNAVQAMGHRPGRLTLKLDPIAVDEALAAILPGLPPGPCVRLTVSDTGSGMDAATQQRVFEPFFTTKGPGEGTGLGLSVVHGVVRSHRGAIRLTSEVGRGSTFEIILPAGRVAPASTPAVTVEEPPLGHGERILFVDDEPQIAKIGKLALCQFGYAAESETEVLKALARLARDPQAFDLIVSDQTMPEMTGLEFARRIRALRADLPVVLASGHSAALTPENIRAAGVREVLAKPYSMEQLALTIRRHLPPVSTS